MRRQPLTTERSCFLGGYCPTARLSLPEVCITSGFISCVSRDIPYKPVWTGRFTCHLLQSTAGTMLLSQDMADSSEARSMSLLEK